MNDDATRGQRPTGWEIPLGLVTGAGIGLLFGILLDQLALGLIIGAAIGLVVATGARGAAVELAARRGQVIAAVIGIALAGVAVILAFTWR